VHRLIRHVAWVAALAAVAGTPAAAIAGDPPANRSLSASTYSACAHTPSGSACITSALADINAARAAEGVPAMVLPSAFASMGVPEQLLNLANLERVDRGLVPILGLSAALNLDAQNAAAQDRDPMPTHFYGNQATANWAGGYASSLEADFVWMYDDGLGSGNLDCTSSDQSGCWGHRHDILWPFAAPIAMGAGSATGQYGPSMTELFVGGDSQTGAGQPDAPVVHPSPAATGGGSTGTGGTGSGTTGSGGTGSGGIGGSGGSGGSASGGMGGGTANPPPPSRPRVLHVSLGGGVIALRVHCTAARRASCALNVLVTAPRPDASIRNRQLTIAALSFRVASGATRTLRVRLNRLGRHLLSARHTLRAGILVTGTGRTGAQITLLRRTVTLRAR
jgi:hypothetical protein